MRAVATGWLLLVLASGCGVGPDLSRAPSPSPEATPVAGAELVVDGRGTFACGDGINTCGALFLIRPAGQTEWLERDGDAGFPLHSTFGDPNYTITGGVEGGARRLPAGDYAMAVIAVQTSHLPSPPTASGELYFYVMGRTTLCSTEVDVPAHARVVTVSVDVTPPCRIRSEIESDDAVSPMPAMR
jgi:hypothetical protein